MPSDRRQLPKQIARASRMELRTWQAVRLRELLRAVAKSNDFWKAKWQAANVDVSDAAVAAMQSPDDLARLPLTTKTEIAADHRAHPPYGSNLTFGVHRASRLHQTSGTTGDPIRWLDTPESWQWVLDCWEQIFEIAGVRADDRLCFPFSFGPFLGFWAAFEGAARRGNMCLPGGGMSSEARLKFIAENQATVVCCTPTYALRLAEVAQELGIGLASSSVRMLIVAGESGGCVPPVRDKIEMAWGARVIDHWGMTEVGSLAVECLENPGGLHLLETECLAEILDPTTGQPSTRGELVITNLGRTCSPMIRYRTGDLVEVDPQPCPCGRQLVRLKGGILGRLDDMLTIRGNNVFPSAIEAILHEFPEVVEFQFGIVTRDAMPQIQIEVETAFGIPNSKDDAKQSQSLIERITAAIHERLHFRPDIIPVPPDSLPRSEFKSRRVRPSR